MELGNMIFGNSRGEVSIPREEAFEGPWQSLCDALKVNWRGYADGGCLVPEKNGALENDTFLIRSYDWDAECDCGFDDRAEVWHNANPHSAECYDTVMDRIMEDYDTATGFKEIERAAYGDDPNPLFSAFNSQSEKVTIDGVVVGQSVVMTPRTDEAMERLRAARDLRDKHEDDNRRRLCAERGLTYPQGCAVHCDCDKSRKANEWFAAHDHTKTCRLVQPNFLYKPTGFRINWYKYPFRDSYMTPGIRPEEWAEIVRVCIKSVVR